MGSESQPSSKESDTQGICGKCQKPIRCVYCSIHPPHCNYFSGEYLTALGRDWHVDCFVCAIPNCDSRLDKIGYIEEDSKPYCKTCYEQKMAYACAKCGFKIIGVRN